MSYQPELALEQELLADIGKITSALDACQGKWIRMKQLIALTGIDGRYIRDRINKARESGVLIASSSSGYKIMSSQGDLDEFNHFMLERLKTGIKNIAFMNRINTEKALAMVRSEIVKEALYETA